MQSHCGNCLSLWYGNKSHLNCNNLLILRRSDSFLDLELGIQELLGHLEDEVTEPFITANDED